MSLVAQADEIHFVVKFSSSKSMDFWIDAAKFREIVPFVHLPANQKGERKASLLNEMMSKAKSNDDLCASLRGGKMVTSEAKAEILAMRARDGNDDTSLPDFPTKVSLASL